VGTNTTQIAPAQLHASATRRLRQVKFSVKWPIGQTVAISIVEWPLYFDATSACLRGLSIFAALAKVATAQTSTPSHGGSGRAADRRRAHGRPRVTAVGVLVVLGRPVGVDAAEHAGGLTDLDDVSVGIA